MRILDLTMFHAPKSGGVKRYLDAKAEYLAGVDGIAHRVLVPGKELKHQRERLFLPEPPLPFSGGYRFPVHLRNWRRAILKFKPDLIELGDPYHLGALGAKMGEELGIPVVGFYHSDLIRMVSGRLGGWAKPLIRTWVRRLYGRCDVVLAPTSIIAQRLSDHGVANVRHQSLGVNVKRFSPEHADPGFKSWLGVSENTRVLLFAGRFAMEKRLRDLAQAMRILKSSYHLVLVGSGEPPTMPENVTVLDYCDDAAQLARLYASADALVHAGDMETFGLVLLEAMACETPVVGVHAGALAELIKPEFGELATPRDGASFAAAVRRLFARDTRAMGVAAREYACEHYSWERVLEQHLGRYRELVRLRLAKDEHGEKPAEVR